MKDKIEKSYEKRRYNLLDLNIPTLHMDIIIWLPGRNNKNILVINQRLALK